MDRKALEQVQEPWKSKHEQGLETGIMFHFSVLDISLFEILKKFASIWHLCEF